MKKRSVFILILLLGSVISFDVAQASDVQSCLWKVTAGVVNVGSESRLLDTGKKYDSPYIDLKIINMTPRIGVRGVNCSVKRDQIYRIIDNNPGTFIVGQKIKADIDVGTTMTVSGNASSFFNWSNLTYEDGTVVKSNKNGNVISYLQSGDKPLSDSALEKTKQESSKIVSKNKTFTEGGFSFEEIKNSYEETYSPTVIGGKLWYIATSKYFDGYNNLTKDHLIGDGKEISISGEDVRVECLKALDDKPTYFVTYRKSGTSFGYYLQYGNKKYEGLQCPDFREEAVQLWNGQVLVLNDYRRMLIVDGKPYETDRVSFIKMTDGQPVYYKDRDGKYELFYGKIKFSLDEYGRDSKYISDVAMIDNKLALNFFYPILCKKDGSCPPGSGKIVYDGKEIKDSRYESMEHPFEYKKALSYVARAKGGGSVIVSGNLEISQKYKAIIYPQVINEKLAYFADNGNGYALYYDNVKKGDYYFHINENFGGKIIEKIGDQFAFIATKNISNKSNKYIVVYGEKEFGTGYDTVTSLQNYNGKLLYVGIADDKRVIVVEEGDTKVSSVVSSSTPVTQNTPTPNIEQPKRNNIFERFWNWFVGLF